MAGASKVFVSGTTAPDSVGATQKVASTASTKEVSALSYAEKSSIERRTGMTINTDGDLLAARTKLLYIDKEDTVMLVGKEPDTAVISTADSKAAADLELLMKQIEETEAVRDDCPDWLNNCPSLPGLGIKKKLKELLEDAARFRDKLSKIDDYLKNKILDGDYLDAWLRCATYASKKGLEGIRQLNEVGKALQAAEDPKTWAAFINILADTDKIRATINDPARYVKNNAKSKRSLDLNSLVNIFQNLEINPNNILNPFSGIPKNSAETKAFIGAVEMYIVDEEGYKDFRGSSSKKKDTNGTCSYSYETDIYDRDRSYVMASSFGVEPENMLMQQQASYMLADNPNSEVDITLASVNSNLSPEGLSYLDSYQELTENKVASDQWVASMNTGSTPSVPVSQLITAKMYQQSVMGAVQPSSPTIQSRYSRSYDNIMLGYA